MVPKSPAFQPVLSPLYSGILESDQSYKNRADAINSEGKLTWQMNCLGVAPPIIGYGTAKPGTYSN